MQLLQLFCSIAKELLAPKLCCHCDAFFTFLCENCYQQIAFSFSNQYLQKQLLTNAPFLDQAITVGSFQGPLKSLVLSLKYGGQVEVANTLVNLAYHTTFVPPIDVVTAVPAHQKRLRKYGFSQSQLLGQHLAKKLNKPYKNVLVRSQTLKSQASITNKQQRKTRQEYTMISKTEKRISGQTVLVVDDVFTTGATLNEAARVLKQNLDAKSVVGFSFAQA